MPDSYDFAMPPEARVYRPQTQQPSGSKTAAYVNKPVTVVGWWVCWDALTGGCFKPRWFGYVKELDRKIPELELHRPFKGPNP